MRRGILLATAATAVAGAGLAIAARRRSDAGNGGDPDRWHSITVNCSPEELGPKPAPLDELGFPVEIRIRPAPGAHGTELAVRAVDADKDAVRHLRRALREARSLAEVGEVLLPDSPPTTHQTLTGAPLAYATRHAREEGRL